MDPWLLVLITLGLIELRLISPLLTALLQVKGKGRARQSPKKEIEYPEFADKPLRSNSIFEARGSKSVSYSD